MFDAILIMVGHGKRLYTIGIAYVYCNVDDNCVMID